jgi:hypothetical protein
LILQDYYIYNEFDEKTYMDILSYLKIENCNIYLSSQNFDESIELNLTEKWY